jgi:outer membrane receptor protein involved in Fe transport
MEKRKMPATVTVITAEELKLLGLRHLTDVINYIVPGGVGDIHRSTRTGLYCFRGITADDNGKFVFMVDGLDCTPQTYWGAFNERYLGLMDELDRIEITQGVGSTLYGSGATSGVINFITKTGKTHQGWELNAGYGSWDKYEDSIKYGEKKSDDEDSFYYFAFKRSHGSVPRGGGGSSLTAYGDRMHGSSGREWDHFGPSYKFHTNINRGDFTLRARYIQEKFEEPYFTKPDCDWWDTADRYWFHSYLFIQPEIKHRFNDRHSIKANASFAMDEMGDEKLRNWYGTASGPLVVKAGDRSLTKGERKFRGQFFHYYDGWENHKLTNGVEYFWMHAGPDFYGDNKRVRYSGGSRVVDVGVDPEDLYYAAVFSEDIWQIDEKSTFFAGVRIEDHKLTPVSITPRFALTHNVDEKTDLKFLYNTGFRTPPWAYYTSNENGGKPKPDPEKVTSYEAHILHKFSPKFSTTLVWYYTIYKDLINYWSSSLGGNSSYYNWPEVRASGLELTGDWRTDNLKLKFSHSFSRPVHFADTASAYNATFLSYNMRDWAQFPTHMSKVQAIINLVEDKAVLGLTYFHPWAIRGQRNADSKLKWGWNFLNATLTLKLKENMEFQISGYNLTGEDNPWWEAYAYDGTSRAVDPHTEYFLRLIWRF